MSVFFETYFKLLADSTPWFLLGAALGSALEIWLPKSWAERWLTGGHRSVVGATLAGAVLPGCAMSTMPVASGLKSQGARLGTLAAFIMVAPLLSPHTVLLSTAMLGWPTTLMRVVVSLAVSLLLGFLLNAAENHHRWFRLKVAPTNNESCSCGPHCNAEPVSTPSSGQPASEAGDCCGKSAGFGQALWKTTRQLGPYFLAGLAVAALLPALVPQETLTRYLQHGMFSYGAAVAVGLPLYVCDGGEVPLTLSLLKLGVSPGPAFAFMLASVGTCLPTMMMAPRIIGVVPAVLYVLATLVAALGGGLLLEWILC